MALEIEESTESLSVAELRRLVKKRERLRFSAMWFLEPIQAYFSYVLIRLGLNSLQVTVLWFCVAFVGYAVTAIGHPLAFLGGALILYLKTILDGCDGEVARYRKQFVSEEEDLTTFIHGVYLDKVFHIIEKPFWGLSLAFGLFQMTGDVRIFAAGISYSVFLAFCRHNATLQKDIPHQFAKRIQSLYEVQGLEPPNSDEQSRESLFVRVADKIEFWMRNGKKFNLLVILAAIVDTVSLAAGGPTVAVLTLVVAVGLLAPFVMWHVVARTVSTRSLIKRAVDS